MVKWYRRWVSDLAPRIWFSLMPLSVSFFFPNLKRLRLTNKEIRKAEIWIETTEFYVSVSKKGSGSGSSCSNVDSAIHWINHYRRGGSRGRVQGVRTPPSPWDDLRFSNTTGILQKQNYVVYWCWGEQETSAPPPKKNPGSAPVSSGYVLGKTIALSSG